MLLYHAEAFCSGADSEGEVDRVACRRPRHPCEPYGSFLGKRLLGLPTLHLKAGERELSMAKAKAGDKPKGAKPIYNARARASPDGEYMQTIGAAWPFEKGDGLVVKLQFIPTDWNGDFILVPPKDDK